MPEKRPSLKSYKSAGHPPWGSPAVFLCKTAGLFVPYLCLRQTIPRQQHRPRLLAEIEDVDVIEPLGVRELDLGMLPLKRGAQVIDGGGVPALADEQPLPIELLEPDAGPAGVPTGP